jgi:hypothetical protein
MSNLVGVLLYLAIAALVVVLLYLVIRAAVRDGIMAADRRRLGLAAEARPAPPIGEAAKRA